MKYDLDQTGLYTVFRPYQLEAMRLLWENRESFSTREVWEHVNRRLESSLTTISRASVINFLGAMEKEGFLKYTETTGKGGHRKLFYSNVTEEGFKELLRQRLYTHVKDNLQ